MDSAKVNEMLRSFGFSDDSENADESMESMEESKASLKCSKCSLDFSQKSALHQHRLACKGKNHSLTFCWACGRSFPYRCLFLSHYSKCFSRHRRKRTNQKLILKDLEVARDWVEGQQKIKTTANVQNSAVSSVSAFKKTQKCSSCQKTFLTIEDLKRHSQIGLCQKKLQACIHCGKYLPPQEHQLHEKLCKEEKWKASLTKKNAVSQIVPTESDSAESDSLEKDSLPKFECKCCNKLFEEPQSLRKHLIKNKSCARVHDLKLRLGHSTGAFSSQKTARKSLINMKRKGTESLSPVKKIKRLKHVNLDDDTAVEENEDSDASNDSYLPPVGAARKTFPAKANKSKNRKSPFCNVCFRYFPSVTQLAKHEETHYKAEMSRKRKAAIDKCPECQQIFTDSHQLFNHQKKFDHYGKATKSVSYSCSCPICKRQFPLVQARNAHLRVHVEDHSEDIIKFLEATTCDICSEVFTTELSKNQHIKLKHKDGSLTQMILITKEPKGERKPGGKPINLETSVVNVTHEMKQELKRHPYTCPVCLKRYSTTFIRNRHFQIHTLSNTFECQLCHAKLEKAEELTQHMQQEHSVETGYECKECGLRFTTWMRALQHCSKSHPDYPAKEIIKRHNVFSDSSQERYSKYASAAMASGSAESRGEEFYCEVCELTFLKLCGLQRHRQSRLHLQILAKSKAVRNTQTSQNQEVIELDNDSGRSVTPPIINYAKNVSCSTCSMEFDNLSDFVPHRLSHFSSNSNEKEVDESNPYSCEICGKVMDNQQKIQLHLFWHLQDMQLQSIPVKTVTKQAIPDSLSGKAVAKKTLSKPSSKVNQELIIGGITKPLFTCDACNIGFTTKHHYSVHIQQHCGSKPGNQPVNDVGKMVKSTSSHMCSGCLSKFDTADDLKTHEKQCTAVRTRYYCQICNCIFLQSDTYEKHKSSCQANKTTVDDQDQSSALAGCGQCNATFDSMHALYEHVKTHHESKITDLKTDFQAPTTNDKDPPASQDQLTDLQSSENDVSNNVPVGATNMLESPSKTFTLNNVLSEAGILHGLGSNSSLGKDKMNDLSEQQTLISEVSAFAGIKDQDELPEDSQEYADAMKELRSNFSRLLYLLVSDPDLMQRLGYGKNLIDEVLVNVMEQMGLPTIPKGSTRNELQRLRQNIRILLDVCIKDQIMELIADSQPTTDSVVITALKMFGVDEQEGIPAEIVV